MPTAFGAELMGTVGFDWICIDTQHGLIGYEAMSQMLQALSISGTPPVVRVAWNSPSEIMRALDAGAQGVIVPLVNTPEEAELAVSACRYPPMGQRSWGPVRAALRMPGYSPQAGNQDVVCVVQVETQQAVERLDEILDVPGVDVVYVGPADLAVSCNLPPTFKVSEMQHRPMIDRILAVCRDRGVVAGIHCTAAADVEHWLAQGFGFVTAGSDRGYMLSAAAHDVAAIEESSLWVRRGA